MLRRWVGSLHLTLAAVVDEHVRSITLRRARHQAPGAEVDAPTLLGKGRAQREAVRDREQCHVVIVHAGQGLALLQLRLELSLVAVPELHVGLELSQLLERGHEPVALREHLRAVEPGVRDDIEHVARIRLPRNAERVLVLREPQVPPGLRRFRVHLGIGDEDHVPGQRGHGDRDAALVAAHEVVGNVRKVPQARLVEGLKNVGKAQRSLTAGHADVCRGSAARLDRGIDVGERNQPILPVWLTDSISMPLALVNSG